MSSFLQIGQGTDSEEYFQQIIDEANQKVESISYAERRAQEMCNVGNDSDDDFALEGRFPIHNPNPNRRRGSNGDGGDRGEGEGPEAACPSDEYAL